MRKLDLLFAVAILTGCATAYKPRGFSGGYSETQLGENVFQVAFNGNGFTSRERAADFALLRSAELALEHGFPFFAVVNGENSTSRSSYTTPTTTTGSATVVGNTVYGSATTTGGETYVTVKPSTRNTIIGFNTKPAGFVYESTYVLRSLRRKYGLPTP